MKQINIFLLFLAFQLPGCIADNPRLPYYKIEDFFVSTYKLNDSDSSRNLDESNFFSNGDSVFIGLSFEISFCDSAVKVFKYSWQPTRGGHGIARKIKNFYILSKIEKGYDTISMSDLKLVRDSFNYIVKYKDIGARVNSISRPGCRMPLDEFIKTINTGDDCFVDNGLRSTHFVYNLNTQKLFNGKNELEFYFEFQDYSLKKSISINLEE